METKKCTKCKSDKELSEFNKNKTRKDGLNNICRICSGNKSREYYDSNRIKHKDVVRTRNAKTILYNRKKMFEYYSTHPCIDCGETDPIVLEFDHRDDSIKREAVSTLANSSYKWETIQEEIDKCDVRCANCHRRRTAIQFGWYKDFINVL